MKLTITSLKRFVLVAATVAVMSGCSILTNITGPSTVTPGQIFDLLVENEFTFSLSIGGVENPPPGEAEEVAGIVFALFIPAGWSIDASQSSYTLQTMDGTFDLDITELPGLPESDIELLLEGEFPGDVPVELELLAELECPLFIEFAESTIPETEDIQIVYLALDVFDVPAIDIEPGDTGGLSLSVRAGGLGGPKQLAAIHGFYGEDIPFEQEGDGELSDETISFCVWFPDESGEPQGPDDIIFPSAVQIEIFQDGDEVVSVPVLNPALLALLVLLLGGSAIIVNRSRASR